MPCCSVVICKNRSSTKDLKRDGITYHRFPRDGIMKEKWLKATGRAPNWCPTANTTICSTHFEERCFQPFKKSRRLFEWAVPTLKLRLVFAQIEENPLPAQSVPQMMAVENNMNVHIKQEYPQANHNRENRLEDNKNMQIKQEYSQAVEIKEQYPQAVHNSGYKKTSNNVDSEDTPRIRQLQVKIEQYANLLKRRNLHIRRLQKRTNRYKKKITQLTETLKEFQSRSQNPPFILGA